MKISFNWLKELVALPPDVGAEEVARRLTLGGLEVESIERRGRDVTGVWVVEVRGVRPHPGTEKLRIVKIATGSGLASATKGDWKAEEEVVCGAPNVPGAGGRVAWAAPGATLPGGVKLGRKEIRGFDSPGMLCSERELGLGEGVDGILILSTDAPVGADLVAHLGIADDIFEVNVTPNRADALSHAGIAREVAALFGVPWKLPPLEGVAGGVGTGAGSAPGSVIESDSGTDGSSIAVDIRDSDACARYHATLIRGVRVGPSPLALRLRLAACGVRPISNIVDVTNYVMLEMGHPLHAFDRDKLRFESAATAKAANRVGAQTIVVRRAAPGEAIQTLDGVERPLELSDIVIADDVGPVALAGVMGGATSEVNASTTNVLLEAATFDPRAVRRTAKRLGMHSEASHRFERGVDAASVADAGARAAALMARLGGGRVGVGVDRYLAPVQPRQVALGAAALRRVAGFDIPTATAAEKLRSVEIAVALDGDGDGLVATVPTFRPDITIAEDLVEEVMRLVGYDQVPARLPAGGKAPDPSPDRLSDRARDLLASLGLNEIAGWAFVPRAALTALGEPALAEAIAVKNPISADYEVMRTSLLPGLAEAARRNLAHGVTDVRVFEVGPVVHPRPGAEHHAQSAYASGLLIGRRPGWLKQGEPIDFFDAKQVVVELLMGLTGQEPTLLPPAAASAVSLLPDGVGRNIFHPGICAQIVAADMACLDNAADRVGVPVPPPCGHVGELHPQVARRLGIDVPAFAFEIHLDGLDGARGTVRAAAPPRFPAVTRDVSFWIVASVPAEAQRAAMRGAGETLLREIAVLEDFRDPRFVPPGHKGMLWTLTYRSDERTLTDAEVDAAHGRVVAVVAAAFSIQIR